MCGINGILTSGKGELFRSTIPVMNKRLAHRGPDAEAMWNDSDIALGHRRLSIIDLSAAGTQPMVSANGRYIMVYNGELYNFRDIKSKLPEYPFKSNTDSEVILAAFQQWGIDCVHRFNGMFAFAIWDCAEKTLYLVRDRMGIKPLYYSSGENFLFSSEIRSILASGLVERKASLQSLVDYLRYQTVHAPQTIIDGINLLEPGHWLKVSYKKTATGVKPVLTNYAYWNLAFPTSYLSPAGKSKSEIRKDIHHLLQKSVEQRLVADVPFGAFLSGGIDSSVIVGLMSKIMTQPVRTLSVTFEEKEYSEAMFSRQISKRFHTEHNEIHLRPAELLQILPFALDDMDHPSGDGLNTWVISKVTRESGITMALSGLGGDELFGGYDLFKRVYYLEIFRLLSRIPRSLRSIPSKILDLSTPSVVIFKTKEILNLPSWKLQNTYPVMRQVLPDEWIQQLLASQLLPPNKVYEMIKAIVALKDSGSDGTTPYGLYSLTSLAEFKSYMQNILLRDTDQMSMAHSLEVRVPFLDFELVEYMLQVKSGHKKSYRPKQLLIESMDGLLPKEIYERKKMGFVFPWDSWMRNELKAFCENYLRKLESHCVFNMNELTKLWSRFLNNDPLVSWSRVWPLVVLSKWMEDNRVDIITPD